MKFYYFFLFFSILAISCRQNISYENVKINDGLYIDSSSGKILDGKYQSITPADEKRVAREHVSIFEYSKGIPIGEWKYSYGGEVIHTGKYLTEATIQENLKELTKSKRVDMNLWKEGDYPFLTINLILPRIIDTLTLQKIFEISKITLSKNYEFNEIMIVDASKSEYIYRREVK